jgi:putative SOS response-associated peptidase YedK
MCGRFGEEEEYVGLARRYRAFVKAVDPGPRYNVAPTDPVAVISEHDEERYLAQASVGPRSFLGAGPFRRLPLERQRREPRVPSVWSRAS